VEGALLEAVLLKGLAGLAQGLVLFTVWAAAVVGLWLAVTLLQMLCPVALAAALVAVPA
jgi:hypothetical protein